MLRMMHVPWSVAEEASLALQTTRSRRPAEAATARAVSRLVGCKKEAARGRRRGRGFRRRAVVEPPGDGGEAIAAAVVGMGRGEGPKDR